MSLRAPTDRFCQWGLGFLPESALGLCRLERKLSVMRGPHHSFSLGALPREPDWRHFPVLSLHCEFTIKGRFQLPPFAGSMFRGVLGWSLKEVCDPATYRYLFETVSDQPGQRDAVRPFLLIPPLESRRLSEGQKFSIQLRLWGRGCDYLPEFTQALILAGDRGLGQSRTPFELSKIVVEEGAAKWVAFDNRAGWDQAYLPLPSALGSYLPAPGELASPRVAMHFHTPTRLMSQGTPLQEPDFQHIVRSSYRRLNQLLALHGTAQSLPSLKDDLEALQAVYAVHQLEWVDWERTSQRQKKRHIMGGFVGHSSFVGALKPQWLQVLAAGQLFHLGKATTFGMGSYTLEISPSSPPLSHH